MRARRLRYSFRTVTGAGYLTFALVVPMTRIGRTNSGVGFGNGIEWLERGESVRVLMGLAAPGRTGKSGTQPAYKYYNAPLSFRFSSLFSLLGCGR